jgi:hypothetical protein
LNEVKRQTEMGKNLIRQQCAACLLVELKSIQKQAKQVGTPGKAKDEPCQVYRLGFEHG